VAQPVCTSDSEDEICSPLITVDMNYCDLEFGLFCPYKGLCSYYDIGDARLATVFPHGPDRDLTVGEASTPR
jgi:hypothetical protein